MLYKIFPQIIFTFSFFRIKSVLVLENIFKFNFRIITQPIKAVVSDIR